MKYIFDNIRPIYIQIIEYVKLDIISNRLKKGDKIPSVREYAAMMKVNPNTVQKALSELERSSLIYTERTNGKYVTNDDNLIKKIREELIDSKIESLFNDLSNLGINKSEIIEYLKRR